ncbi:helix-turn-helix domain-containing protein [Hassallia byssoidea VB512170]|uniref:Helix-turn-helix domain-containing protein n=1 Tax=Hassallia byssoidea VB512170 TaxID=1304833 RepID=A0A846H704_9CYAN|nr:helix-turn-helix domain-containing protein [Hassalia byssoidea VB512170]
MKIEQFIQRTEAFHRRLADLNQTAIALPCLKSEMLPQAFKELSSNSRMLQLAAEELYVQNEDLIRTRNLLEEQCDRYHNLFYFAPNAYLLTNTQGIIIEANYLATTLFKIPQNSLVGKALIKFFPLEERRRFRNHLVEVLKSDSSRELSVSLYQRDGKLLNLTLTEAADPNQQGKPINLLWVVREIPQPEQTEANNEIYFTENRFIYKYSKGETITLKPSEIFYVCQGLVKLNTFCETGEEVLTGLVGEKMVFGSSLTSLQTYQATALVDVELVSIDVAEIASPALSHALLPKINQRLRQTESFLAISGRQRVQERLHYLLLLLKQEIGQPIPQGTRLNVRLTHEELASACCTTRVTITRLMGKLQKQGVIRFDSKKHIILQNLT